MLIAINCHKLPYYGKCHISHMANMAIAIIWQFMAIYGNQQTLPNFIYKIQLILEKNLK